MPEWITRIGGTGTGLTQAEQDNNILCIYGALSQYGWTKEAIAGACGCFHEESGFNPGIYETSHGGNLNNLPYFPGGMGLAQWTDYPAYQAAYPNPLPWSAQREGEDWYNGNFQCWLLTKCNDPSYTSMGYGQGPRWGWQKSSSYPSIDFNTYIHSSNISVDMMTEFWFYDMEWHYSVVPDGYLKARKEWANYAYQIMKGKDPEVPGGGGEPIDPSDPTSSDWYIIGVIKKMNERRRKRNGSRRTVLL